MSTMTLAPVQTIAPGTRCVSVRGVPGGMGYHAPAVYEATARKDGALTWRHVSDPLGFYWCGHRRMAVGHRSERLAEERAQAIADGLGLAFISGIRHGSRCA